MRIETDGTERVLQGVGVAPGIAIGPVARTDSGTLAVPEYAVPPEKVEEERARLARAIDRSRRQLAALKAKARDLPKSAAEELGLLLDAHGRMLTGSRLVRGADQRIAGGQNAEAALQAEVSEIARGFEGLKDAYLAARAEDVRDVGRRVIRNLSEGPSLGSARLPKGAVLVAEEITPADTALIGPGSVAGLAAALGGPEGHTAIMARTLGIPAVLGIPDLARQIPPDAQVILDGEHGRLILNPREATLLRYLKRQAELEEERRKLARLHDVPAITRDGVPVTLCANIEFPRDTDSALDAGAAGIGLFRTEFLFMNRDRPPGEEEQYEALAETVRAMGGKPVTIRTLDVGGEKLAHSLSDLLAPSANPALGLRAIRLALREPRLLDDQLAAILRAGALGPVRILLPMITQVSEVRQVRDRLARVARRLRRRRVPIANPLPPLGAMIEVPGAALAADALAGVVDFFAIGTNDLTMYTLAVDRADEQVAQLYSPLHPGVLRLIQFALHAARKRGIPVSICGEMAGDPIFTALLLGLGVRDLSMTPRAIARVKQRLLTLDAAAAEGRALAIMEQTDIGRIRMLLADLEG